jgi:hypothetical protein
MEELAKLPFSTMIAASPQTKILRIPDKKSLSCISPALHYVGLLETVCRSHVGKASILVSTAVRRRNLAFTIRCLLAAERAILSEICRVRPSRDEAQHPSEAATLLREIIQ